MVFTLLVEKYMSSGYEHLFTTNDIKIYLQTMGDFNYLKINSLFGAEPIPYSALSDISNKSADLIVYAIPVMAFFTFAEMIHSWATQKRR